MNDKPQTAMNERLTIDKRRRAAIMFANTILKELDGYIPYKLHQEVLYKLLEFSYDNELELTSAAMRKEYEAWKSNNDLNIFLNKIIKCSDNKFLPTTHKHEVCLYQPKSDKDIGRIETAFIEQADKLERMADLLGSMRPISNNVNMKKLLDQIERGEMPDLSNVQIVDIACCKACFDKFISNLEDAVAISKDLRTMIDKAGHGEVSVLDIDGKK